MTRYFALLVVCFTYLWGDPLTWETPQVLSTPNLSASDPRIGMSVNGNLVAAWIENGVVMANTRMYQNSWNNSAFQVSDVGAASLELVVDSTGNATAIWAQNGVIQVASLANGGTWETPISISSTGSSSPQIAVDSTGNLTAIWICNGIIQSAIKPFHNAWSSPISISHPSLLADSPQIAIGGNENIIAVWHSTYNGIDAIYSSSTKLSQGWPAGVSLISTLNVPSVHPQIALNSKGAPIAVWFRYNRSGTNYSNVFVQTALGNADTTWNEPTDLSSPGVMNPNNLTLHVAYNARDMAFVLWTNCYDFISYNLEGSVYDTMRWIPSITFLNDNIYLYDQAFSISSLGYAYAAFMKYDSSSASPVIQTLKANTYNVTPNYGSMTTISTSGTNGYPRIQGALIGEQTNYAACAWLSNNGLNTVVQVSTGQTAILSAPTSLAVTQSANDLGLFTEYYNTLSWQGNPPTEAANWTIFRNGVWVGTVPVTTFQWIDHNAIQTQPCVYGVALQEVDGDYSQISTVAYP